MAIGGKTTKGTQINSSTCLQDECAFIMRYTNRDSDAPTSLVLTSQVTTDNGDNVTVIGVLALAIVTTTGNLYDGAINGVFDTGGNSLILFRMWNGTILQVWAPSDHSNYCLDSPFNQKLFTIANLSNWAVCYTDCDSGNVYVASFRMNGYKQLVEYRKNNSIELIPIAIHMSQNGNLNKVFLAGLVDTGNDITPQIFVQIINQFQDKALLERAYRITQEDLQAFTGDTFEPFDIAHFKVQRSLDWLLVCHGNTNKNGILIIVKLQQDTVNFRDIYITDTNDSSRKMEIMSLAVKSGPRGYMTVHDQSNGEYILFSDMVLAEGNVQFQVYKIDLTNKATNPAFDWLSRITKILTDDENNLLAYGLSGGPGFAFRKAASPTEKNCITMTLGNEINTFTATLDASNSNDDRKVLAEALTMWVSVTDIKPSWNGTYYNKAAYAYITGFPQDAQLNNPCKLRVAMDFNDITYVINSQLQEYEIQYHEMQYVDQCPYATIEGDAADPVNAQNPFSQTSSNAKIMLTELIQLNGPRTNVTDSLIVAGEWICVTSYQDRIVYYPNQFPQSELQTNFILSYQVGLWSETDAEIWERIDSQNSFNLEITQCTSDFAQPTTLQSSYSHHIGFGATVIDFTGVKDGNCYWHSSLTIDCTECTDPIQEDIESLLGVSFSQEQLQHQEQLQQDSIHLYQYNVINDGYLSIDPLNESSEAVYTLTYQIFDHSAVELFSHTFDIDVYDNACSPDPIIDSEFWSETTIFDLHIGSSINIDISGITHGNCQYNFTDPPTESPSGIANFDGQVIYDVLQPVFTTDPADINIVQSVFSDGSLLLDGSHLTADAIIGEISLSMEANFVNSAPYPNGVSSQDIEFKINLRYCDAIYPATNPVFNNTQMTGAAEARSTTIFGQNSATSCSKTQIKVIDDSTGEIPDPSIFSITQADATQVTISILQDLPNEVAGNYNLTIIESNISDDQDKFETTMTVQIFQFCDLCELVAAPALDQVSGINMESFQEQFEVTLAWNDFTYVKSQKVNNRTITDQMCLETCPITVGNFTATTSLTEALDTKVTYDNETRTASLLLPDSLNLLIENTNFIFEISITELSGDSLVQSATLDTEFSVNFVYIAPEEPELFFVEDPVDEEEEAEPEPELVPEKEAEEEAEEQPVEEEVEAIVFEWKPPPVPTPRPRQRPPQTEKEVYNPPPLVVSESAINETGTLTIEFNKPVFTPEVFVDPYFKDHIENFVSVQVISAFFDDERPEIQIIEFQLMEFDAISFTILVSFAKPAYITQSLVDQDTLQVSFLQANMFQDKIDYVLLKEGTQLSVKLPPQMSMEDFIELQVLEAQVDSPMTLFSTISLFSNVFLAYGLKYLWNMVNLLQFLVFFQYWKINIHASAQMFITQIRKLALFEFIDTSFFTDWMKDLFGMSEEEIEQDFCDPEDLQLPCHSEDENLRRFLRYLQEDSNAAKNETEADTEESGSDLDRLGSANIMDNLGIWLLFSVLGACFVIFLVSLAIVLRKNERAQKLFKKIKEKIFWNSIIRFVIQGTLGMQISAGASLILTLKEQQLNTQANPEETLISADEEEGSILMKIMPSIMILMFFNIVPIVFILVLTSKNYRKRLQDEDVRRQIGNMYASVDPRYTGSLWYNVVYLLRRSCYVLITFSMFDYPGIQIQAFIYLTLLYLIYLHHFPVFNEKFTLQIETMNEVIFIIMCYHMVLFSNLVWNPELKKQIGQSLVFFVFVLLGINTLVILMVSIKGFFRSRRLKYLKKIQDQEQAKKDLLYSVIEAAIFLNIIFFKDLNEKKFKANQEVLKMEQDFILKKTRKTLAMRIKQTQRQSKQKSCCGFGPTIKTNKEQFYDAMAEIRREYQLVQQKKMQLLEAQQAEQLANNDDIQSNQGSEKTVIGLPAYSGQSQLIDQNTRNKRQSQQQQRQHNILLTISEEDEQEDHALVVDEESNAKLLAQFGLLDRKNSNMPAEIEQKQPNVNEPQTNIVAQKVNDHKEIKVEDSSENSQDDDQQQIEAIEEEKDRIVSEVRQDEEVGLEVDDGELTVLQYQSTFKLINTVLTLRYPTEKKVGSKFFPWLRKNPLDQYRDRITTVLNELKAQQQQLQNQ